MAIHEECGVFGVMSTQKENVAGITYYGLYALQHRGQESCGIAVSETGGPKGKVTSYKGMGLVNEVLAAVGLEKVPWLAGTKYSKIPVILLIVWRNTPWFTMIVLSGLLNISADYYEAATVDGANGWQKFLFITLPSISNILFFCSVTLTVDMWKIFNEPYILPGPGTSNTSLFQYMYESGFNVFNMGYASAIGVIIMVMLTVVSVAQFLVRKRQGEVA